jgi:hypothetical protein
MCYNMFDWAVCLTKMGGRSSCWLCTQLGGAVLLVGCPTFVFAAVQFGDVCDAHLTSLTACKWLLTCCSG